MSSSVLAPHMPALPSAGAIAAPQQSHTPVSIPQTEEFYHSLPYYKMIDRSGETLAKIDAKDPVSARIAQVATDKIHEVLREFLREPIIQWTRKLCKSEAERRPDDVSVSFDRSLLPADDAKRLVKIFGTSRLITRIPKQVAQNFGQTIPLINTPVGPLGIELCQRMGAIFYYAFRPELQLLKVLHDKTAAEKATDDLDFLRTLYATRENPNSMISHLATEVFRRMVEIDSRFGHNFEVGYTLLVGDHKLGIISSPFGYPMII